MAGKLPGLEHGRRRPRHFQIGGWSDYPTMPTYVSRSITVQDLKLEEVAREAKGRLDEKFKTRRKLLDSKRSDNRESNNKYMAQGRLTTEVYTLKQSGSKRLLSWAKSKWPKTMDQQEECAICLERFKDGETLVHPPCAHRFHYRCLAPWLENNPHCPCCRMSISSL